LGNGRENGIGEITQSTSSRGWGEGAAFRFRGTGENELRISLRTKRDDKKHCTYLDVGGGGNAVHLKGELVIVIPWRSAAIGPFVKLVSCREAARPDGYSRKGGQTRKGGGVETNGTWSESTKGVAYGLLSYWGKEKRVKGRDGGN